MTKPDTDAIEGAYKDNLSKMFNVLFDAYIQDQGPAGAIHESARWSGFLLEADATSRATEEAIKRMKDPEPTLARVGK